MANYSPGTSSSSSPPALIDDFQFHYFDPYTRDVDLEAGIVPDDGDSGSEQDLPRSPDEMEHWKTLPPDDQFDLTMCSVDSKQKVQSLDLGVTRITFNDGRLIIGVSNRDFDNDEKNINIEIISRPGYPSKFRQITSYLKSKIWKKFLIRQINGVDYEIQKVHHNDFKVDCTYEGFSYQYVNFRKEFCIYTHDTTSAYKNILRHIFFIFPNETPLFYLDLRGIHAEDSEVPTQLVTHYDQCRQCPCLSIGIRSNEFVEQAHRILEMMENLTSLNMDISLSETEFFSPRMRQIDHLNVAYHGNQISEANLISLDCESIKLWSVRITASALNAFIKKWLGSNGQRFQFLEIPIMTLDETDSDPRDIFKGLNVTDYDEIQRSAFYRPFDWNFEFNCTGRYRHINCYKGKDIRRADGALATIVASPTAFYFFVWHDRFPEQPRNHLPYCDE